MEQKEAQSAPNIKSHPLSSKQHYNFVLISLLRVTKPLKSSHLN